MQKKTKKPTKQNPQDATLRNIRALKKRVALLEHRSRFHEYLIDKLGAVIGSRAGLASRPDADQTRKKRK